MNGTTARPKDELAMPGIGLPRKATRMSESRQGGGRIGTVLIASKSERRS